MIEFRDSAVGAAFEDLRRELAQDAALHPERAPPDPSALRPGERFRERLGAVVRTLEYGTAADIGRALRSASACCRETQTVVEFPRRPRRRIPPPADLPPAAA